MPEIRSLSIHGRELRLLRYDEVDSTQRVARGLVERGAGPGTIVIAGSQTAGHGRYGREWASPPGGLYASIVLDPDPLLPLRAGVAVAEALSGYGIAARLKWPNDVTVGGKKIAGILVEAAGGAMILGIGVNLEGIPYPGATSVRAAGGSVPRPDELVVRIVAPLVVPVPGDEIIARYHELCTTIGREVAVSVGAEVIRGRATGIDRWGRLAVRTMEGIRRVSSGECLHISG